MGIRQSSECHRRGEVSLEIGGASIPSNVVYTDRGTTAWIAEEAIQTNQFEASCVQENSNGSTTNHTLCWRIRAVPNQTPLCASQSGTLLRICQLDPCFLEV